MINCTPYITKEKLSELREGLLVGSGSETGELCNALVNGDSDKKLFELAKFYDYLEICPSMGESEAFDIVRLGEQMNIPVCATGNVYFLSIDQKINPIININGKQCIWEDEPVWRLCLESTEEMLESISFLGEDKAREVVIANTVRIADMIDELHPMGRQIVSESV